MDEIQEEFKSLREIMKHEKSSGRLQRPFENFLNGVMERINKELSKPSDDSKMLDLIDGDMVLFDETLHNNCHLKVREIVKLLPEKQAK